MASNERIEWEKLQQGRTVRHEPKYSRFTVADGSPIESMLTEAGYEKTQENVYPGWNVWVREAR